MGHKQPKSKQHELPEIRFRPRDHVSPIFSNISRGSRYYVELTADHLYPEHSDSMILGRTMYNLELQWNGIPHTGWFMSLYTCLC